VDKQALFKAETNNCILKNTKDDKLNITKLQESLDIIFKKLFPAKHTMEKEIILDMVTGVLDINTSIVRK